MTTSSPSGRDLATGRTYSIAAEPNARFQTAALHALFGFLVAVNLVRTLRHAMWRDEIQIFMIAVDSSNLAELFHNLKYDVHPGLWYLLVWLVTRVTADPISMQILHVALAVATWLLIYHWSPFGPVEKLFLLLSYFLFWEYFVISRSYVLIALLGFGTVVMLAHRPRPIVLPFLLLGLLANTMIFGTIWSMVMAAVYALQTKPSAKLLAGAMLYLGLLAVAVLTMRPPPDFAAHSYGAAPVDLFKRVSSIVSIPVGAFLPIKPSWFADAIGFLTNPQGAPYPHFWNPNPTKEMIKVVGLDGDGFRIALFLALPPAGAWVILRDKVRTAEFTLVYLGISLFCVLWSYPGSSRHHGILFLALVGGVWMARTEQLNPVRPSRFWQAILMVSAIGGLLTLSSELRPFSNGRYAAEWLQRNRLDGAFIMGSRDTTVSTIAGYLRRPVYYLECQCMGRFIVFNTNRTQFLPSDQIVRRTEQALLERAHPDAILISNSVITPDDMANAPNLDFTLLQTFADAEVSTENYFIFRVTIPRPLGGAR
jgi:hypothetical protein